MNITISFRNKSISLDGFSCFCDDIVKLEDDWVSIEINPTYGITLYRVGLRDTLEDISFINPWVEYALNEKKKFEDILEQQKQDEFSTLITIEENEQKALENIERYEKEYAEYLMEVDKANKVDQQINKVEEEQPPSLLENRFKIVTNP